MADPGPYGRDRKTDQLLSVKDLCKSFKNSETRIDILKEINLDFEYGDSIAIVGASGIGKSTLLHLLGALDQPDSGSYLFQGNSVFDFDPGRLAKFRNESIGFVFQFHYLLNDFSAIENVMMPALIKGMDRTVAKNKAETILVKLGLKERLFYRAGKLSGGEQQRVALARALVLKPVLLLADEPTGNLDKKSSDQIHEILLDLNHNLQLTIMVVTHNMELASSMSRKATIIDGKLVELGG